MNKYEIKLWIESVLFALSVGFIIFMFFSILDGSEDNDMNKNEIICDELAMDVLSVSRQIFGDDYVVCYNVNTNETRRIVI